MPKKVSPPDDPNEKPYPGHAREVAEREAKATAQRSAASEPLPGALRDAYAGTPPTLHGFTLQPVRQRLHVLLTRIDSPLLGIVRIMAEELSREDGADESTEAFKTAARSARMQKAHARCVAELKFAPEQEVETVFCFVRPAKELLAILDTGRATFREAAMEAVSDRLSPVQFAQLQQLVSAWYSASFDTSLQCEAPSSPGDNTVFTKPPAVTTESAGG